LAKYSVKLVSKKIGKNIPNVEDIQDAVEESLIKA
jgi:hypothetical protein